LRATSPWRRRRTRALLKCPGSEGQYRRRRCPAGGRRPTRLAVEVRARWAANSQHGATSVRPRQRGGAIHRQEERDQRGETPCGVRTQPSDRPPRCQVAQAREKAHLIVGPGLIARKPARIGHLARLLMQQKVPPLGSRPAALGVAAPSAPSDNRQSPHGPIRARQQPKGPAQPADGRRRTSSIAALGALLLLTDSVLAPMIRSSTHRPRADDTSRRNANCPDKTLASPTMTTTRGPRPHFSTRFSLHSRRGRRPNDDRTNRGHFRLL